MRQRCTNPKSSSYYLYGIRGIRILWKTFEEFRDDMLDSYNKHVKQFGEDNTTLDRINNNGHYCKENCRWATQKEQSNNARSNIYFIYNGLRKNISQWAEYINIPYSTLYNRIVVHNRPIEKALSYRYNKEKTKQDFIESTQSKDD